MDTTRDNNLFDAERLSIHDQECAGSFKVGL